MLVYLPWPWAAGTVHLEAQEPNGEGGGSLAPGKGRNQRQVPPPGWQGGAQEGGKGDSPVPESLVPVSSLRQVRGVGSKDPSQSFPTPFQCSRSYSRLQL